MAVQLIHMEFVYNHKYTNCSGKPFSQINSLSVVRLYEPECNATEASKSQLFINSAIEGSIHSSFFVTVALLDTFVDIEDTLTSILVHPTELLDFSPMFKRLQSDIIQYLLPVG